MIGIVDHAARGGYIAFPTTFVDAGGAATGPIGTAGSWPSTPGKPARKATCASLREHSAFPLAQAFANPSVVQRPPERRAVMFLRLHRGRVRTPVGVLRGGHADADRRYESMMSARATASAASPPTLGIERSHDHPLKGGVEHWFMSGRRPGPSSPHPRRRGTRARSADAVRAPVGHRGCACHGRSSASMRPMVDRVHRGPPQCCSVTEDE